MTEAEAEMMATAEEPVRKRTFLQKLKKKTGFGRSKKASQEDGRDQTPSPVASKEVENTASSPQALTRDGVPIITSDAADDFVPSDVNKENAELFQGSSPRKSPRVKKQVVLSKPPPVDESAFQGPPRYDWVDIVSSPLVDCCFTAPWCFLESRCFSSRRLPVWFLFHPLILTETGLSWLPSYYEFFLFLHNFIFIDIFVYVYL